MGLISNTRKEKRKKNKEKTRLRNRETVVNFLSEICMRRAEKEISTDKDEK